MHVARHRFMDLNQLALSLRIGSFNCEVLSWGFFEPRWWRNYLHLHSFFEVCYAYQGQGLFRIAHTDHPVHAGEVFVARPGEVHEIVSSVEDPLGIYFWSYTLVPHSDHSVEAPESQSTDLLLHAFPTSHCSISARTPAMLRTLELLTEEVAQQDPGYSQIISGLVVKLILDTARAVVDLPARSDPADPRARNAEEATVQMIVRYLRDNYSRPIAIRDLAAQVHLSERHTSRLFHKIMGVSIMDHLTALRLDIAAQLLLDQQMSIKEVAQETGYPDVRYFTTLFRQHMGLTPAAFRQKGGTRFIH